MLILPILKKRGLKIKNTHTFLANGLIYQRFKLSLGI